MTSIKLRPRFKYHSQHEPAEIQARVKDHLSTDDRCIGTVIDGYVVLKIAPEDYHYWSPQLSLTLEEDEKGSLVRGLYGPNPNVWVLFIFGYGSISFMALFACIIGFSRWSLGMDAPILWIFPILGAVALGLYITGQLGQKFGAAQLFTLHHFLEEALEERVQVY